MSLFGHADIYVMDLADTHAAAHCAGVKRRQENVLRRSGWKNGMPVTSAVEWLPDQKTYAVTRTAQVPFLRYRALGALRRVARHPKTPKAIRRAIHRWLP